MVHGDMSLKNGLTEVVANLIADAVAPAFLSQ